MLQIYYSGTYENFLMSLPQRSKGKQNLTLLSPVCLWGALV